MGYLRKHPLVSFALLAFVFHWLLLAASAANLIPYQAAVLPGSWTPNIAAFIVVGLILREPAGVRQLLAGWTRWRLRWSWYLAAGSPLAVAALTVALYLLLGNQRVAPVQPFSLGGLLFLIVGSLITGATGEELGWRGFLLPRLQARHTVLVASLIVGAVWAVWHLPLWFLPGQAWAETPMWAFVLLTVSSSVVFAWLVNSTGGSMVMASLMHLAQNVAISLAGMLGVPAARYTIIASVVYVGYAALVVALAGADRLARDARPQPK